MAKKYRVGVIGFAHMHINALLDSFAKLPNVEWVACADTVPDVPSISMKESTRGANLKRAREVTKVPRVYDDYREMLKHDTYDIVIFCPENAKHGEVAEAIAAAGANLVTEKPMAASLAEALRVSRAVTSRGLKMMVNWPTTWSPAVRAMKTLIDQGTVGDVWEIKWRNGPSMGPMSYGVGANLVNDDEKAAEWWHQSAPGGGALLDYCCYGSCLSRWFLGEQAVAATGMKANLTSHYGNAEDNAVITVRFPHAIAILEGTWTTWHSGLPTGPIAYGSKGTLVVANRKDPSTGKEEDVVEVWTTRGHGGEPDRIVRGEPMPAGRATLAEEFIHHLETGDPLHPTLQLAHNVDVMAILDAGIRSAASGKLEVINDGSWCIG